MKDSFGYDILKLDYRSVVRKYGVSKCREVDLFKYCSVVFCRVVHFIYGYIINLL